MTLPFHIRLDYFNLRWVFKSIEFHNQIENTAFIRCEHDVSNTLNDRVEVGLVVQFDTSLVEESEDRTTHRQTILYVPI
jgi:hypothetical protein